MTVARTYLPNEGKREHPIRVGLERGVYHFVADYAADLGMSLSAAARRLILLGARCESEHGHVRMPQSFDKLEKQKTELQMILEDEF